MGGRHLKVFAEVNATGSQAAAVLALAESHGLAVQLAPDRVGLSCQEQVDAIRRKYPQVQITQHKVAHKEHAEAAPGLKPKFKLSYKIERSPAQVFDALVDPVKLCSYFTRTASGPLAKGATVQWTFADSEQVYQVAVEEVTPHQTVQFTWGPRQVRVRFDLEPQGDATRITVHASGWTADEASLTDSYSECSGWQEVLCSMRAKLQHGISL